MAQMGRISFFDFQPLGITMSSPAPQTQTHEADAVESVVSSMPLVLPLAGAVLMFLLAFIAVSMA
jgi:hypothetical protein